MDLGICMLRGVSGLDAYQDGFGAQVALPESFDQQKRIRFGVEVGSAYETILPVKMSAARFRYPASFGRTPTACRRGSPMRICV